MQNHFASIALAAASLLAVGAAQATPTYLPFGAQANVSLSTGTAGGWTQCYLAAFNVAIGSSGQNALNQCAGDYIMMAGRETGSNTLLALAATTRADAIIDTGGFGVSTTHVSNGARWWYSGDFSWGFAGLNDVVINGVCNVGASAIGMCLHTSNTVGGWRINEIQRLSGSTAYEQMFFVADRSNNNVPEPGSLALALVGLALAGATSALRRKAR